MALPVNPVIGNIYTIGDYSFEYMGDGVFQRKDIAIPDSSKWEADGETSIKPKGAKTVDASHISGLPDGSNWEGDGVGYIKPKDLNLVKRKHIEISEEEYVEPDDSSRWEDDGATHIKPKDLKLVDRDYLDIDEIEVSDIGGGITDILYEDLRTLLETQQATAGTFYRITDYRTTHRIPNTGDTNTGIIEPLIVTAISENKLMPEAYSVAFPGDVIYYSPDNDQDKVSGCTKGYIYRRVDTKQNNDFPFDFRQVKFRRWQISQPTWDETTSYSKGDVVKSTTNDTLWMSLVDGNTGNEVGSDNSFWRQFEWSNNSYPAWSSEFFPSDEVGWFLTPNANYQDYNMFAIPADYNSATSNKIDAPKGNIIEQCNTVIFGANFSSNSIGAGFYDNSIGANFYFNSIGANFYFNSIGAYFSYNSIGTDFSYNSIGANFSSNSIGANFSHNSIGAYFYFNSIGANFSSNSIGAYFSSNSIGAGFYDNSIGANFYFNSIGTDFYFNSIGANFSSNSIGAYFSSNSIGAGFYDNSIGANFSSNSIDANFSSNSIDANFYDNSIGAYFSSNSIGAGFYDNSIGANFSSNSIDANFSSNSIDANFYDNSIDANFSYNSIGANFRYVTGTVQEVDFSLATHVYQNYPCEIFKRQDGQTRLRYVDNSDVQVIVNANA